VLQSQILRRERSNDEANPKIAVAGAVAALSDDLVLGSGVNRHGKAIIQPVSIKEIKR
jgi:hypothetical protein